MYSLPELSTCHSCLSLSLSWLSDKYSFVGWRVSKLINSKKRVQLGCHETLVGLFTQGGKGQLRSRIVLEELTCCSAN